MSDTVRLLILSGVGAWTFLSTYQDFKNPKKRRLILKFLIWHFAIGLPLAIAYLVYMWDKV